MKRGLASLLCLAAVFALAITARAQDQSVEYGRFEELKGVQKIFVDTGDDLALRNIIKDILEKQLHLTVADRPEDAEHVMIFRWSSGGNLWFGRAFVAKRISPERLRILSSYRASETELDDLADEYAKWFAKRFKALGGS